MERVASMRKQMKRKREGSQGEQSEPTPERPSQKEPKWSGGGIFRYIPEELCCEVLSVVGGIHLSCLPPIPPKPSPPVAPARIPVGVFHDGAAPYVRITITRNRVGRLVFLSSKINRGAEIPHLVGEFGESAAENIVLFHQDYDTRAKRRDAHAKLLFERENAKKEQAASYVAAVKKYIRDRRYWEIETVAMLVEEDQCHGIRFPAPHTEVLKSLLEWAPTKDPILGYGIHKPISKYDLAEFEPSLSSATSKTEGKQTPSSSSSSSTTPLITSKRLRLRVKPLK